MEQVRIKDGDSVRVMKRVEETNPKGVLVTPDKKMSDRAIIVITEVFGKFAQEGKISRARFFDLAKICMHNAEKEKVQDVVKSIFDYQDQGSKGYMTCEEFIKYYEATLKNCEETVWGNLKSLGYNNELRHYDQTRKNGASPRGKSYGNLPRYILSNNARCFEFLFQLFSISSFLISL